MIDRAGEEPLGVTLPAQPGLPKPRIYIDRENCQKALGRTDSVGMAKELIGLVLWHEWHHTGPGGGVQGGCDHAGLHYATAERACARATELKAIEDNTSIPAAGREAARQGRLGACKTFKEAVSRLKEKKYKNCPKSPGERSGPPDWKLPAATPPPCPACS